MIANYFTGSQFGGDNTEGFYTFYNSTQAMDKIWYQVDPSACIDSLILLEKIKFLGLMDVEVHL